MTTLKKRTPNVAKVDSASTLPWIEKYRPKTVDDVSHQEDVVRTLKKSIESRNLPHLLFYGPPGTGKTSTILAIGRTLYGPELFKSRVMELNASDERGINVVRHKVKEFAKLATGSVATTASSNVTPPYKLIILDEADSMTADAQAALRRTMETYSKTTRFCLICNYVSRIIEPLASRCAKFRFKPLNLGSMEDRIRFICKEEGVPFSSDLAQALNTVSGGDLRKAITTLQMAFALYGDNTSAKSIIDIAGVVPSEVIDDLMKSARSNSFDQLQKAAQNIIAEGYPASQIMSQLFDRIVDSKLSELKKARIAEQLALSDKCLQDGADEFLQLMAVLSVVMKEFCS